MDLVKLINELIERICVNDFCEGSPTYGTLKYVVQACDLTILKRRVSLAMGEKINKFGLKIKHGCTWTEWQISHPECLAQVQRLESFGVQHGKYVRDHLVDHELTNQAIPEHVEWVGDAQVLQDALTYLNMVS